MVKKQIFELLSALCYNSQRGYDMALEALQIAKVIQALFFIDVKWSDLLDKTMYSSKRPVVFI